MTHNVTKYPWVNDNDFYITSSDRIFHNLLNPSHTNFLVLLCQHGNY